MPGSKTRNNIYCFCEFEMKNNVYITKLSKFLPNNPISNSEMEGYLGGVDDRHFVTRSIILKSNGINSRYYALDKDGRATHSNAQLTADAIKNLFDQAKNEEAIQFLACGTTTPDQLLPSHTSMVHGLLRCKNIELASFSGACCSGIQALKAGWLSVLSSNSDNAVCSGSERISNWLQAKKFIKEAENIAKLKANLYIAFEKEFLRWMLSDGAGAALLEKHPAGSLSLKIDWIEITSYAHELETCMYAGAEKNGDGQLKGWSDFDTQEWLDKSVFSLKQDVKLLRDLIVPTGLRFLNQVMKKHDLDLQEISYFLPHLSSEFFREKIQDELKNAGLDIPQQKWFTNLSRVGNVGAASAYLMLEELFNSGKLVKGEKILMMVPESARFTYAYLLLTVC